MAGDPRLGTLLGRDGGATPLVALLGFPTDVGVQRNGGRAGAAGGPAAIRQALARLTPDAESVEAFVHVAERTADLGDVPVTGDLERDQEALAGRVAPLLGDSTMVVILGGGHETTYGHFLGYVRAGLPVSLINWDAHCDVREPADGRGSSGTPFRQALAHPSALARRYTVAGLQPHSVAHEHRAFVMAHGDAIWRRDVTRATIHALYEHAEPAALVSFDLDAVDRAWAPGVSAPNTGGLPVELWLEAAYRAGYASTVRSADLVELNPTVDRDGQTAALAALTVWQILKGVSDRLAGGGRHPSGASSGAASR